MSAAKLHFYSLKQHAEIFSYQFYLKQGRFSWWFHSGRPPVQPVDTDSLKGLSHPEPPK